MFEAHTEVEELFRTHGDLIFATAYAVTKMREDAEDVTQSVFLRLLRIERLADLTQNPRGYLYRAALNLSLDIIRSRRRESSKIAAAQFTLSAGIVENGAQEYSSKLVEDAIAQLGPQAKALWNLKYVQERSDSEIAELVGSTRGAVAVSLFRARAKVVGLVRASALGSATNEI